MAEEKRILIVDDDAMSRRMAEMILKKTIHEIITADSGDKCIDILKKESVDLLLLDVEMPGKGGMETLREVRKIEGLEELPVIFLTGTSDDEKMEEAKRLGAIGFAIKPLRPADLLARVESAI